MSRLVAYGYSPSDAGLDIKARGLINGQDASFRVLPSKRATHYSDLIGRTPRLCHLGVGPRRACNPVPNGDSLCVAYGLFNRIAVFMRDPHPVIMRMFLDHVDTKVLPTLRPVEDIPTMEEWLESTKYTRKMKNQILSDWNNEVISPIQIPKQSHCKSFIKLEQYPEFKQPRIINGREMATIMTYANLIVAAEHSLYKHEWLVKKIAVTNRAGNLAENFPTVGGHIIGSDFTSFECSISHTLLHLVEKRMLKHMFRNTGFESQIDEYYELVANTNTMVFKNMKASVFGKRMSGDRTTSFGTCLIMIALFSFVFEYYNLEYVIRVEGDDVIAWVNHLFPVDIFDLLGFSIKLDHYEQVNYASFCGLIFDDSHNILTNPMKVILNTPWVDAKYRDSKCTKIRALQRAKALSILYQYPGCPVLGPYAAMVLRASTGTIHRGTFDKMIASTYANRTGQNYDDFYAYFGQFPGSSMLHAVITYRPVTMMGRVMVEDMFAMSVDEQLMLEESFATNFNEDLLDYPDDAVYFAMYYVAPAREPWNFDQNSLSTAKMPYWFNVDSYNYVK
jgi:hypothetical protein